MSSLKRNKPLLNLIQLFMMHPLVRFCIGNISAHSFLLDFILFYFLLSIELENLRDASRFETTQGICASCLVLLNHTRLVTIYCFGSSLQKGCKCQKGSECLFFFYACKDGIFIGVPAYKLAASRQSCFPDITFSMHWVNGSVMFLWN